jgi:hypothetical protein
MAVEFSATGTEDAIGFGYLPHTNDLAARTMCAWVYLDSNPTDDNVIMGIFSDGGGNYLSIRRPGSDNVLSLYTNLFDTDPGRWDADSDPISTGAWHHVAATYSPQDDSADPVFYLNGSPVVNTEIDTPSGTALSEYGVSLILGNVKTIAHDYDLPFDGQIKDVRIYNRILTAAEIATIYADGAVAPTVTSGLVFQPFCVRTRDVTDYTDLTLTSEDTLIDNIYGCIGVPHGDPITRTI